MHHEHPKQHWLSTLWVLTIALTGSNCAKSSPETLDIPNAPSQTVRVGILEPARHPDQRSVSIFPIEDYVVGSVLAEANLSGPETTTRFRLAQLQAILARTYATTNLGRHAIDGFDLCSTTHCQVYRDPTGSSDDLVHTVIEAVQSTTGLLVTYKNDPINAVFHANCGGHTSDADTVWGGIAPAYLRGTPDAYCLYEGQDNWRFNIKQSDLRNLLNDNSATRIGKSLHDFSIKDIDDAGRVQFVTVKGERLVNIRGTLLRTILTSRYGPRSIKSTRFATFREGKHFVFEGSGFGHGVGLCQAGARSRIRAGHTVQEVLQHYYPGTVLQRPRVSPARP